MRRDHPYLGRSKWGNIGKLPSPSCYEKMILSTTPHSTDDDDLPTSYLDAVRRDDASSWIEAMILELKSLKKRNAWELVPPPKHQKMIQSKWVYEQKENGQKMVTRSKAFFVAKGFSQISGVDFNEVLSAVSKYTKLSRMNSLLVNHNWER